MSKIETGGPAFPVSTRPLESEHGYGHQDGASTWQFGGMTLREYAAITLRVPQSGTDWLDDMIREARRMDAAEKAMQGLQANSCEEVCRMGHVEMAEYSSEMADTLLAAQEKAE